MLYPGTTSKGYMLLTPWHTCTHPTPAQMSQSRHSLEGAIKVLINTLLCVLLDIPLRLSDLKHILRYKSCSGTLGTEN